MRKFLIKFYSTVMTLFVVFIIGFTSVDVYADSNEEESVALQQVTITGTVVDEEGFPMPGVNVIVKGTVLGTFTDAGGKYTLSVPNGDVVLEFTFIGYAAQEVKLGGRTVVDVSMKPESTALEEIVVVGYATQKKETLTGAISSVKTEELLVSPNASVANSLAGKISGLSSVQSSGQPGAEDPRIFIRGVGSLTEGGASPLILVDGVERSFFQMDPNEIDNITVLKDASATAVFGVRGANGVVLVTTKRGSEKGKAKISINSSAGFQMPTRTLEMTDSYTYAKLYNEQEMNDDRAVVFDDYVLERFRLNDEPVMYPNIKWRDYMTKKTALQTQHNLNVSGGTDRTRYFISMGYLHQDGLFRDFGQKDLGYKYNRYNYRTNLDLDITKSTLLKIGIGGIVGDREEPTDTDLWMRINRSQPFSSAGVIDGKPVVTQERYPSIKMENPIARYYGCGNIKRVSNTMNLDLHVVQKLDFLTKGLSVEVKGAYNTDYNFIKTRKGGMEIYTPYYESELDGSGLGLTDPGFNKNIVYLISGTNSKPGYNESYGRGRNWYFEASTRYKRKFSGKHNVGVLLLYNQNKKYYPAQLPYLPAAYVGLVGRVTYDYKSRYLAEFNIGYNGSENFAPDKRFGTFPALSLGYILSEEKFMKRQKVFDLLKLRASVGLVGNDNMQSNRYLYLPDSYDVDKSAKENSWKTNKWGYNFGYDNNVLIKGSVENRLGNPDVTWETALKQNYGIDMNLLGDRLKMKAEYFQEDRKDILIARQTIPGLTALTNRLLPVVNMGKVKNRGYEIELDWNDAVGDDFHYTANFNMSYSKNKIIFKDEIEPNEPYLWRTGQPVGSIFGYVTEGFYSAEDFTDESFSKLKENMPVPQAPVKPGDVKYRDLNSDCVIDPDDQMKIGYPTRPNYVFGLNVGADYKGFFFSMNWTGAAERSLVLADDFRKPFCGEARGLMQHQVDHRWTQETEGIAKYPRFSVNSANHNYMTSTMWIKNGAYLKLKNLTFGYNFTGYSFFQTLGISQLGLKFIAYNLLTFDHFKIMDPESNPNHYGDTYPVVKIFNLGVNLTF